MSEDNEKIFGGIKDKLIVWELGNAVTGVTGVDYETMTSLKSLCISALTQAMGTSSIPIVASKNKIPLRGHIDTLSCVPRTTI